MFRIPDTHMMAGAARCLVQVGDQLLDPYRQRLARLYKTVKTDDPCAVCGGEIQPGQLYAPGPRHLGCRR